MARISSLSLSCMAGMTFSVPIFAVLMTPHFIPILRIVFSLWRTRRFRPVRRVNFARNGGRVQDIELI